MHRKQYVKVIKYLNIYVLNIKIKIIFSQGKDNFAEVKYKKLKIIFK